MVDVGTYVIDIHHDLGLWDVAKSDSMEDAEGTARSAGLATAGLGVLLLIVGGLLTSIGGRKG